MRVYTEGVFRLGYWLYSDLRALIQTIWSSGFWPSGWSQLSVVDSLEVTNQRANANWTKQGQGLSPVGPHIIWEQVTPGLLGPWGGPWWYKLRLKNLKWTNCQLHDRRVWGTWAERWCHPASQPAGLDICFHQHPDLQIESTRKSWTQERPCCPRPPAEPED